LNGSILFQQRILDDNLNAGEKVMQNALPPKESLLKEEDAAQK
jgi:hypothetical protein